MRVIEKGKPWSVQFICDGWGNGGQGCKATLEAELEDLRWFEGTDYPVYRESAVCARCPECGTITDVKTKNWPARTAELKKWSSLWQKGLD